MKSILSRGISFPGSGRNKCEFPLHLFQTIHINETSPFFIQWAKSQTQLEVNNSRVLDAWFAMSDPTKTWRSGLKNWSFVVSYPRSIYSNALSSFHKLSGSLATGVRIWWKIAHPIDGNEILAGTCLSIVWNSQGQSVMISNTYESQ